MRKGVAAASMLLLGCGAGIRRDLSGVSPGTVGFEDMCGLQAYFDAIEIRHSAPPRLVSAVDLQGARGGGGRALWAFETAPQIETVRRVLAENWTRLPETLAQARRIDLGVVWTEKAGIPRVVTDQAATLVVGDRTTALPYHPCLSELLYGAPLYRERRAALGLPLALPPMTSIFGPSRAPPPTPAAAPPAPVAAPAAVVPPPMPAPAPTPTPAAPPGAFRPAPPATPSPAEPAAPAPAPAPTFKPAPPAEPQGATIDR